jgi:hypothetical protein
MQLKPSEERRPRDLHGGLPHGPTLSARGYLELGRQPRLGPLPVQRPP